MSGFDSKIAAQKYRKFADDIKAQVPIDDALYRAFATIEREIFIPKGFKHQAYKLDPLPLAENQWISSPVSVAKMTLALQIDESVDSVLEIGCGSGYQAAVLSRLIRRVFTIERIEPLLIEAKKCFKMLGITNIHTRFDDGQKGWREFAPFDRILLSASIANIPDALFAQLKEGGILVAPIETLQERGKSVQIVTQFMKQNGKIRLKTLEECLFVPIVDGTSR